MVKNEVIEEHKNKSDVHRYLIELAESAFRSLCVVYKPLKDLEGRNLSVEELEMKKVLLRSFFIDIQKFNELYFQFLVYQYGKVVVKEGGGIIDYQNEFMKNKRFIKVPSLNLEYVDKNKDPMRYKKIYKKYFKSYFDFEAQPNPDSDDNCAYRTEFINAYADLMNFHYACQHPLNHTKEYLRRLRNDLVHSDTDIRDFDTSELADYLQYYDATFSGFFVPYESILSTLPPELTQHLPSQYHP